MSLESLYTPHKPLEPILAARSHTDKPGIHISQEIRLTFPCSALPWLKKAPANSCFENKSILNGAEADDEEKQADVFQSDSTDICKVQPGCS